MKILRSLKIVLLFGCLVGLIVGAFWLGGALLDAENRAKANVSQGRFDQLELALKIYYEDHGSFPPTKYQRVVGEPIHSWRVLVLPYTTRDFIERYRNYAFSQEWNSPTNLQVLGRTASPLFRIDGTGEITHYLAIGVGDEWPSKKPLRSRLITKGKDRFLLVEYPDSNIHWMEPKY